MEMPNYNKVSTPKCNSYPSLTARKATINALALIYNGHGALGMGIKNIGVGEQLETWRDWSLCMSNMDL